MPSAPGLVRTALFLGGSLLLHGVGALMLLGTPPAHPVILAPPSAVVVEVGWRQGSAPPAAPGPSPSPLVPVKRLAPRRVPAPAALPPVVERVALAARPPRPVEPPTAPPTSEAVVAPTAPQEAPSTPEAAPGPGTEAVGPLAASAGAGGGTEGPGPAGSGTTASGGGRGEALDLSAYGQRLSSLITRQRRYPASALRLRMEGTAVVRVLLRGDGSLVAAPQVVTSSRYGVLDAEALRMVEAAVPFAPLPEGPPSAEFVIPVRFSLRSPD